MSTSPDRKGGEGNSVLEALTEHFERDVRGQSEAVGVVLVLGMVVLGALAVAGLGAVAISDTESQISEDRAQKTLTQFDSKAGLVALREADSQQVGFPTGSGGQFYVNPGAGWMNVSYFDDSGTATEIFNESMGALAYESDGTIIAYQGSGVWRRSTENSTDSVMISPPEFHYRDATLTLPLVSITGQEILGDRAQITLENTVQHYPDPTTTKFLNPVNGTEVNITVQSEYYKGWGRYFETRTEGNVTYNHNDKRVMVSLIPPFDEEFENVLATTSGGITCNGCTAPEPNEEGIHYPGIDARIEDKIDECDNNPAACDDIPVSGYITTPGTYWEDGSYTNGVTIDSPNGNVTLVVNGDFNPKSVTITDVDNPYSVTVYVRENFDITDDYNGIDGNPYELRVVLHSDGSVNNNGNSQFVGLIYAPLSDCSLNGGGPPGKTNLRGGMVCSNIDINGNPNKFQYDPRINDISLDLNADDVIRLQYLHVTTNEITVGD